jgi:ATP/maltotriose-dependent transcriptional regulator MalT
MYADWWSFSVPIQSLQSYPAPIPLTGDRTTIPRGMLLTELQSASLSGGALRKGQVLDGRRFLVTKVVPPRCPGLIGRPRLLALASRLTAKRLAVIKAPAGFGKTSLAASWSDWLRESASSVAWLAIDSGDDEPSRFLFYMTQAMQRVAPAVGSDALDLIKESFLISPQAIVSSLINDLIDVDEEIYLFLEDYHWVTHPGIHDAVAFFLRHAPSHAHVVLTTRTEPPLPLASLRANNQLLEIDASTLRFDLQETRELLEREKPGSLELADVKLLHSRTEGWPAALRIVASTSSRGQDFAQFVRNLSGTQRTINAYLAEMLDGLAGDIVSFMLRTAILDRMSGPLCDVVTQATSSQDFLVSIEKRQLLLTALDQDSKWFRYHPLLAEYLKQRLGSELGNELAELHQRAAGWYASQELWTEAVQHAIAAGDTNQALDWIEKCAMGLVKRGDLFTLLAWQRLFEDAISTLKSLRDDAERVQNHYFTLRVATHLCVVRFSAGQTAEALSELRRVLDVSALAGIHQTIIDEGPKIGPLLAAFDETSDRTGASPNLKPYVNGLLAAWRSRYQSGAELSSRYGRTDPLSAREGDILNLIAKGLSNKEIARSLAIAPETVKSHVKNIFIKLNSEKRAQAVARAQSLGLVATR